MCVCVCVCVLGTCYHNYKGIILVWTLRHEPVLWRGWTRTVGRMVSALVQLTIHLGVRVWWWPAGVVASVAACVPIVSRYNERVCLTRLGRGVILCLPCVCSPNNCHRTAPHRIESRRTALHRTAPHPGHSNPAPTCGKFDIPHRITL